mmetsp:Transcript_43116/g.106452  ORF Transcript_43116/g.106452 Transcript_43116/m.106452 type:complete len:441 (-) Transcript_43116:448-1770(-)
MGSTQSQAEVAEAHKLGVIVAVAEDIPEGNEDFDEMSAALSPPRGPTLPRPITDQASGGAGAEQARRSETVADPADLPFKLGRTLGTGAFGKVKLGVHNQTKERIAVKVVPREKLQDKRLQANMAREIRMMKLLRNEHIIRLYDVVVARTKIYLAMEYADGGDMLAHVNSRKPLTEEEAATIFVQVIDGVGFCHKLGVCHRDLKLENLLICGDKVKIADFGLANYAPPPTTNAGSFMETHCGSPLYAAPELLRNTAAYDATKVDVWSLGVVLYALVTKKLPFEGDGLPAILKKIVTGEFNVPPHLSPPVVDLICKMLCVDPVVRVSVEEIEKHEWVRLHTEKKTDQVERTISVGNLAAEMAALQAATREASIEAGATLPPAPPVVDKGEKRRPTTMTTADFKREIAEARAEALRGREDAARAEAALAGRPVPPLGAPGPS